MISFYRGAWCPYCNLELHALQQALPDIEASGGQLVAISPNDPNVHYFSAMVESLVGDHDAAVDSLADALRLGYSVRIIRADPYFQPFLNSAKLAEWLQEDVS